MIPRSWNTAILWRLLMGIIGFTLMMILLILVYLPLRAAIEREASIPEFDKRVLQKAFDKRQNTKEEFDYDKIVKGIHVSTGMVYDDDFLLIQQNCLSCHSSKLITQNRADRKGWKEMIVWMQETQGLHDLGNSEPQILDYLSTHYAPQKLGRRPNLNIEEIEWYILELVDD